MEELDEVIVDFTKENFFNYIEDSTLKYSDSISVRNDPKLIYLYNYFKHLRARYIIAEKNYVDKDYSIDYSLFYSRSFFPYNKKCLRLSFFSGKNTKEKITSIIRDFDKRVLEDISGNFLGFIVIKPLAERYVGRTVLRTYPNEDKRKKIIRIFPRLANYQASLYGMPLRINSVAFQEQDKAVSACATVALWVALHKLRDLFNTPLLSPSEITLESGKNFPLLGRIFPSEGLNAYQIVSFLKKIDLEIQYIDMEERGQIFDNNDKVKILLFSYLKFGLPVIIKLKLCTHDQTRTAYHAATILGYNLVTGEKEADLIKKKKKNYFFYESDLIEEFYIHDDQIGPFARSKFREEKYCLENEWLKTEWDEIMIDDLIIPLYHKIRLSFFSVYRYAELNLKMTLIKAGEKNNTWFKASIYLADVNQYKEEILKLGLLKGSKRIDLLTKSLPKFLWVLRVFNENKLIFDCIFDATDLREIPSYYFDFQ